MRLTLTLSAAALATLCATTMANATTTSCQTVVACVLGVNQSSGYAIEGYSRFGTALIGTTVSNTTQAAGARSGVAGYDRSTNNNVFNAGVSGTSAFGTGVKGVSSNGTGVAGSTSAPASAFGNGGIGVLGNDTSNVTGDTSNFGVKGLSNYGTGVEGGSGDGDGVIGFGLIGVFGQGGLEGHGTGVQGDSMHDIGVLATTVDGFALVARATSGTALELSAPESYDGYPQFLLSGYDTGRGPAVTTVSIDAEGDEYLAGTLTTNGTTTARTSSSTGASVASYGARSASPTLEDFGRGTLANGVAHVALDRTFASTIDARSYLVFVTPHGDSRGLYTTLPTATGFDVRENARGRSTLAFDYRVVARPLDTAVGHLPAMSALAHVARATHARHATANLTPRRIVRN